MSVDISGLDKIELLFEMWSFAKTPSFFTDISRSDCIDAKKLVSAGFIEMFNGRSIRADISKDTVNPAMYDRIMGQGSLAKIVATLRTIHEGSQSAKKSSLYSSMGSDDTDSSSSCSASTGSSCCLTSYKCQGVAGNFRPSGEPAIKGIPGTVLCKNCNYWLEKHVPVYQYC